MEQSQRRHRDGGPPIGQRQVRYLAAAAQPVVDEIKRTVELSFSSRAPVSRWFGNEVLSHAPGAADFSRLNSSGALLFNHKADDVLGVVESAEVARDGKGRAVVRFGSDARGDWAMHQVTDGILTNVSFSYFVDEYEDGPGADTLTATRWTALEISFVTVPADPSVGVGRSHQSKGIRIMDDDNNDAGRNSRGTVRAEARGAKTERERIGDLMALAKMHGLEQLSQRWIDDGALIDVARAEVLRHVTGRPAQPVAALPRDGSGLSLGLNANETRRFSLVRAINACINKDWSDAGFERECSRAVAGSLGVETRGFFVPMDVQQRTPWLPQQQAVQTRAPYQVGTAVQGGNLVQTQLLYDNFIEALRNSSQVMEAGALVLSGLTGNVDIPRRTAVTGTNWIAESGALTETEATFDKVTLRPKTVGALSKMSRNMLLQSTPAIEMLTRQDIMMQIGLSVDLAALSGSGASNQPTGIVNQAGVGGVIGGANGATVVMDYFIQLEAALANSNAPVGSRAYIANSKTIATQKKQVASTGAYIWTQAASGQRTGAPPEINGLPIRTSNQARSNLTKGTSSGVCSEVFFGAWEELVIGQWGVLEILVNPYDATGFTTGDVLVRGMQTIDIATRHGASFAVMSDALTP